MPDAELRAAADAAHAKTGILDRTSPTASPPIWASAAYGSPAASVSRIAIAPEPVLRNPAVLPGRNHPAPSTPKANGSCSRPLDKLMNGRTTLVIAHRLRTPS
jgi:hypothetical protein